MDKTLESVVEGTRNNVVLLPFGKGVELNSVTRNANGQLRILSDVPEHQEECP